MREEGELRGKEIVARERRWQEEKKWDKIRDSRFNKWYCKVKEKRVPEYLKEGWKEKK